VKALVNEPYFMLYRNMASTTASSLLEMDVLARPGVMMNISGRGGRIWEMVGKSFGFSKQMPGQTQQESFK